jgi:hypothetical protein
MMLALSASIDFELHDVLDGSPEKTFVDALSESVNYTNFSIALEVSYVEPCPH